jgi:hypothetical protein
MVVVGALAGVLTLVALAQTSNLPAPSLTAPSPDASPSPTASAAPEEGAPVTADLDGQDVWLVEPAAAPIGIAVLFPGAADDPASLLQTTAAEDLLAAGWAVSTGEFHGASWGSPESSADVSALRTWLGEQVGALPTYYVAVEMGGSTSLASMIRSPELPVACWYGAAPVTDLATIATAVPAVGDQLVSAWGRIPDTEETILAQVGALPADATYRVVVPGEGAEDLRIADAETLISTLEASGLQVSETTAGGALATVSEIDAADVTATAEGCLG